MAASPKKALFIVTSTSTPKDGSPTGARTGAEGSPQEGPRTGGLL
jgi:hypothetical protein